MASHDRPIEPPEWLAEREDQPHQELTPDQVSEVAGTLGWSFATRPPEAAGPTVLEVAGLIERSGIPLTAEDHARLTSELEEPGEPILVVKQMTDLAETGTGAATAKEAARLLDEWLADADESYLHALEGNDAWFLIMLVGTRFSTRAGIAMLEIEQLLRKQR